MGREILPRHYLNFLKDYSFFYSWWKLNIYSKTSIIGDFLGKLVLEVISRPLSSVKQLTNSLQHCIIKHVTLIRCTNKPLKRYYISRNSKCADFKNNVCRKSSYLTKVFIRKKNYLALNYSFLTLSNCNGCRYFYRFACRHTVGLWRSEECGVVKVRPASWLQTCRACVSILVYVTLSYDYYLVEKMTLARLHSFLFEECGTSSDKAMPRTTTMITREG